jgi:hypothetical protein
VRRIERSVFHRHPTLTDTPSSSRARARSSSSVASGFSSTHDESLARAAPSSFGALPPTDFGGSWRRCFTRRAHAGDTLSRSHTTLVLCPSSYSASTRSLRSIE